MDVEMKPGPKKRLHEENEEDEGKSMAVKQKVRERITERFLKLLRREANDIE